MEMENINKVLVTLTMWGYSEKTRQIIKKKMEEGVEHHFRNGMMLSELIYSMSQNKMENLIEEIKNHNFDNGNYVIKEGLEVSFDGDVFKLELPNEVVVFEQLEELKEYEFLI